MRVDEFFTGKHDNLTDIIWKCANLEQVASKERVDYHTVNKFCETEFGDIQVNIRALDTVNELIRELEEEKKYEIDSDEYENTVSD